MRDARPALSWQKQGRGSEWGEPSDAKGGGDVTTAISENPTPTVRVVAEVRPRVFVAMGFITQHVEAEAFGSPSDARRLGEAAVDEHAEALRRLADS
jgi:hypothetical protein